MRLAICGSHAVGKSTLIASFVARRPEYAYEPEAFETLGDEIDLSESGGPTAESLRALLEYTVRSVAAHPPGTCVVHERSPVDYLAYAAASRRSWPKGEASRFLATHAPLVRACLGHLDLIAFVPVSTDTSHGWPGEGARFRRSVDEHLRRALIDDDHDLLGTRDSPRVVELPPSQGRQLDELIRLTAAVSGRRG